MTTGQPVGEIYCAYLPPGLAWITEPLAQVIGRSPFTLHSATWQTTVNIALGAGVPALGQHWLGALSMIARRPGAPEAKPLKPDAVYQGPWRLDTRISATLPSGDLIRRRFITNAVAVTLAVCAMTFTSWLLYTTQSLANDAAFWTQQIASKHQEVEALNALTRELTTQSDRIDAAYALAAMPYRLTQFLLALGRTRPATMQIDGLDSLERGAVLRGVLHEPSDKARVTINGYREALQREPAISAAFGSVTLTSFSRRDARASSPEAYEFELTFKARP